MLFQYRNKIIKLIYYIEKNGGVNSTFSLVIFDIKDFLRLMDI